MAEESTLDELRRRLGKLQARHEVDGAAAAREFWRSLQGPAAAGLSRESAARPGSSAADTSARGCRIPGGSRKGGAWTASSLPPSGRGLWAHVDQTEEVPVRPREMSWADDLSAADEEARWRAYAEAGSAMGPDDASEDCGETAEGASLAAPDISPAAAASEAAAGEGAWPGPTAAAAGPVGVQIDAVTGRPLDRHGEVEVLVAAEQAASLRAQHDVMLVNLVAELEARGADSPGGLSRVDWLRSLDPGMTAGQAKAFVTVARAMTDPAWAELAAHVTMQHVTVGKAALIIDFRQRTAPVADPDDLATALGDLMAQAAQLTPEVLARLARHHGEQVRPPREQERLDAGRQEARGLWFGQPSANGMVAMRATLDPEAAAIITSAVDPLAAPCPARDEQGRTVATDPRTPAKRRADALLEVLQRGVASAEHVPTTDKAKIVVTIDHDVLAGRLEGTGLAMTGDVLSAPTVRRLACDAAIVPMVLGGASEPLELGRERRLVTKGLRLALWQRDGGCSFPGCTIPASWCDAHHVVPWYLGGQTNLLGMALLCRRHHTHVHRRELTATVTATSVAWHE